MFIKPTDVIKMRSTIKSFVRDWSVEVNASLYNIFRVKRKEICATNQFMMKLFHIFLLHITLRLDRELVYCIPGVDLED
jgi:hypothetical protein